MEINTVNRNKVADPASRKHFIREQLSKLDKEGDSVLLEVNRVTPYYTIKTLYEKLKKSFFPGKNIHYATVRNRSGNITHLKAFIGNPRRGPRFKRIKHDH